MTTPGTWLRTTTRTFADYIATEPTRYQQICPELRACVNR